MAEEWKECMDGWYEVSDHGRVRRAKPGKTTRVGKILKGRTDLRGYLIVSCFINGKTHTPRVHRLVSHAFLGPCPEGLQVNHIDGIKTNACSDNLEYITGKENMAHALKLGLIGDNRLFPQSVIDLARELRTQGKIYREIARATGMSTSQCQRVVNGKRRSKPYGNPRLAATETKKTRGFR